VLSERDHKFATDMLNASLTLLTILVAVITVLVVEYKRVYSDPTIAEPIYNAVMGTTGSSVLAGVIALLALIHMRSERGSISYLMLAMGALIVIMTGGIIYDVDALMT
jgi:integral membrane sensor domain MASE1